MKHLSLVLICAVAVMLMGRAAPAKLGPSFSLDDNPAMPLTSPPGGIPGFGAEDPFGLGTYGGAWAPSPTLIAPPAMDADILKPAPAGGVVPVLDVAMSSMYGQPFGYVNAVADNADVTALGLPKAAALHLGFSVDRITMGQAGTAVNGEALLSQHPGDIYRTSLTFMHPINFVWFPVGGSGYQGPLPTAGVGGGNFMVFDESQLMLTAGNGVGNLVPPGVPCPPVGRGTHDNADAVNWQQFDVNPLDMNTDTWLFFSVAPDEATITGATSAGIYTVPPNNPATATVGYAPPAQIGLLDFGPHERDDIDALVLWDDATGVPGVADPNIDYALFSLSHGSLSLTQYGLSESDIFFTNFNGGFWLYARDIDLGLQGAPGLLPGDNVDALEVMVPGDANLDGMVDIQDFSILKANFGSWTATWITADFNGDQTVDVQDFSILKGNFATATAPEPTPEPATLALLTAGALPLIRRRRKRAL